MTELNPYAAPKAHVDDTVSGADGSFVPDGRAVPGRNGLTWISDGWIFFRCQPAMFIAAWFLYYVVTNLVMPQVVPFIGAIVGGFLSVLISAGVWTGYQAVHSGERFEFRHLGHGFRERTGTIIKLMLLTSFALLVAILPGMAILGFGFYSVFSSGVDPQALQSAGDVGAMIGMIGGAWVYFAIGLLVAIGLIVPVMMAYWFALPLIVLHDHGARASMKASFRACLKNMGPFLIYGLAFIPIAILASLPVFLGWLVAGPLIGTSTYTAYRDIFFSR